MNSASYPARSRTRIEQAKAKFTIPVLWRMSNLPGEPARSCRSPFREYRSPSFSISEDGLRFIDLGSGERGDSVDFLAKIKGISNAEAYIDLLRMVDGTAGLGATRLPEVKTEAPRRTQSPGPKLQQAELFLEDRPPGSDRG